MVTREPVLPLSGLARELEARARRVRADGPPRPARPDLDELVASPRRALLAQRSRIHLGIRLASRLGVAVRRPSAGAVPARVAIVGAAVDVATGLWLRRDSRPLLGARLVGEVAEVALASALADDGPEARHVLLPGMALAMEAGFRESPLAVAVPAATYASAAMVRLGRGHRLQPAHLAWQVGSAAVGVLCSRYERSEWLRAAVEHEQRSGARAQAAELAGQNEVAVGADTVVDELQRAAALIDYGARDGGADRPSTTSLTSAWKETLAEAVRERSAYLHDVVAGWQQLHNLDPDLSTLVRATVPAPSATAVLTAAQAEQLRGCLDGLGLRGDVTVELVGGGHRPTGTLRVRVDGVVCELRDGEPPPWRVDLLPVAFDVGVLRIVATSAGHGRVPWWCSVPHAAAGAVLGQWARRRSRRGGRRAVVAAASLPLALSFTVSSMRSQAVRATAVDSMQQLPPLTGVIELAQVLVVLVWDELTPSERWAAVVALVGLVGLTWALAPRTPPWLFATELVWALIAPAAIRHFERDQARAAAELVRALEEHDRTAIDAAWQRGRARVLDYVGRAAAETRRLLEDAGDRLDGDVQLEASRRLERVDQRLAVLLDGGA